MEEEEVADTPHELVVSLLLYVLLSWAIARGSTVLASDTKYALSKRRGRKPDISVHLSADPRLPRRAPSRIPGS